MLVPINVSKHKFTTPCEKCGCVYRYDTKGSSECVDCVQRRARAQRKAKKDAVAAAEAAARTQSVEARDAAIVRQTERDLRSMRRVGAKIGLWTITAYDTDTSLFTLTCVCGSTKTCEVQFAHASDKCPQCATRIWIHGRNAAVGRDIREAMAREGIYRVEKRAALDNLAQLSRPTKPVPITLPEHDYEKRHMR